MNFLLFWPEIRKGLVNDWEVMKKWFDSKSGELNIDYFLSCLKRVEETKISIQLSESELFTGDDKLQIETSYSFEDFLTKTWSMGAERGMKRPSLSVSSYLAQCSLSQFPSLLTDLPSYTHSHNVNLWLSPQRTICATHNDKDAGWLIVLRGEKRCCLAPPSSSSLLQAPSLNASSYHHSPLNILLDTPTLSASINREDRKRKRSISFHTFLLKAGDALFIPAGWWHQIESSPGTVAINIWKENESNEVSKDVSLEAIYEDSLQASRLPLQRLALSKARLSSFSSLIDFSKEKESIYQYLKRKREENYSFSPEEAFQIIELIEEEKEEEEKEIIDEKLFLDLSRKRETFLTACLQESIKEGVLF